MSPQVLPSPTIMRFASRYGAKAEAAKALIHTGDWPIHVGAKPAPAAAPPIPPTAEGRAVNHTTSHPDPCNCPICALKSASPGTYRATSEIVIPTFGAIHSSPAWPASP